MRTFPTRGGFAIIAFALLAGCEADDAAPTVDRDTTPTSPSSAPLPSVDSAPAGGGGGPGASDPIGSGQP